MFCSPGIRRAKILVHPPVPLIANRATFSTWRLWRVSCPSVNIVPDKVVAGHNCDFLKFPEHRRLLILTYLDLKWLPTHSNIRVYINVDGNLPSLERSFLIRNSYTISMSRCKELYQFGSLAVYPWCPLSINTARLRDILYMANQRCYICFG